MPAVTFPASERHSRLAGTNFYCLVNSGTCMRDSRKPIFFFKWNIFCVPNNRKKTITKKLMKKQTSTRYRFYTLLKNNKFSTKTSNSVELFYFLLDYLEHTKL